MSKPPVSPVLFYVEGAVASVTLNRPSKRNALDPEMIVRLADAWDSVSARPDIRVVVLTGAGQKAFSAGADLRRLIPLLSGARPPDDVWDERLLADRGIVRRALLKTVDFTTPIVAAVNGDALAGGTELLLATDIRIASKAAKFGLPEVRSGLIPAGGSMARLPRQIGYCNAMALLLLGNSIDAPEALRIGLVNEVVDPLDVEPRAREVASELAANGPFAVRTVKQVVAAGMGASLQEAFRIEDAGARAVMRSKDAREGPRAFAEGRRPIFTGD